MNDKVQRWRKTHDDLIESDDGDWIEYTDHARLMAERDARIAELEAILPPSEAGDGVNHDCQNPLGPCFHPSHATPPAAPAEGDWLRELIEAAKVVEQTCVRHDANDAAAFRRLEAAILSAPRVTGGREDLP